MKPADFDCHALFEAMDAKRNSEGLSWSGVTKAIWGMSAELNARRHDHPINPATITSMSKRGDTTCQHALFFLHWLNRTPESFLTNAPPSGDAALPNAGSNRRLRWDLRRLYEAVNGRRTELGLTWTQLAQELRCTPNQLMGIQRARFAIGMRLAMRIVQWLGMPAAAFIYAARW